MRVYTHLAHAVIVCVLLDQAMAYAATKVPFPSQDEVIALVHPQKRLVVEVPALITGVSVGLTSYKLQIRSRSVEVSIPTEPQETNLVIHTVLGPRAIVVLRPAEVEDAESLVSFVRDEKRAVARDEKHATPAIRARALHHSKTSPLHLRNRHHYRLSLRPAIGWSRIGLAGVKATSVFTGIALCGSRSSSRPYFLAICIFHSHPQTPLGSPSQCRISQFQPRCRAKIERIIDATGLELRIGASAGDSWIVTVDAGIGTLATHSSEQQLVEYEAGSTTPYTSFTTQKREIHLSPVGSATAGLAYRVTHDWQIGFSVRTKATVLTDIDYRAAWLQTVLKYRL